MEQMQRLATPSRTSGSARSVPMVVHAPPAKIGPNPLRWDGVEPLAREASDFLQTFPWVLGAFEALDSLRFGFFRCVCHKYLPTSCPRLFCPANSYTHRQRPLPAVAN